MRKARKPTLDWSVILSSCDALLRSGQVAEAQALIAQLDYKAVPRVHAAKAAHMLVRTGLFMDAITLLLPVIHPKLALAMPATPAETAIYALALIKVGSTDEALQLLAGLQDGIPEKNLYTAFAAQSLWDYETAIPHLRTYLTSTGLSVYDATIARVNLLAGLIATDANDEARALARELRRVTTSEGWTLLQKNVQELSGQLLIRTNDLAQAKRELSQANNEFDIPATIWDFFLAKWNAIVDLRLNPDSPECRGAMLRLRARALEMQHWESVRECDRVLAQATRDAELLMRVYFGTPHAAYRAGLLREAAEWFQMPEKFVVGSQHGVVLDLTTGATLDGALKLKVGQALHRCLQVMASDLYKPIFVGNLHAKLFPGEYYNPASSPGRVLNVIKRLRAWFREADIPLTLQIQDRSYRLTWTTEPPSCGLLYESEVASSPMDVSLAQLKTTLPWAAFTSVEAAEALAISKSSVVKILTWGLEHQRLKKTGTGKSTRYTFAA